MTNYADEIRFFLTGEAIRRARDVQSLNTSEAKMPTNAPDPTKAYVQYKCPTTGQTYTVGPNDYSITAADGLTYYGVIEVNCLCRSRHELSTEPDE